MAAVVVALPNYLALFMMLLHVIFRQHLQTLITCECVFCSCYLHVLFDTGVIAGHKQRKLECSQKNISFQYFYSSYDIIPVDSRK